MTPKPQRKKSFEGFIDIRELEKLKWVEGMLLVPHLCRVLPYDYEKKVRITIEEL